MRQSPRGSDHVEGGAPGRRAPPVQGWVVRSLALTVLAMSAVGAIRPIVSYRALELGASAVDLGVVAGSYALLSFLLAAPMGRWIDRLGEPRFAVAGTCIIACAGALLWQADGLMAVVAAQALLGLGQVTALLSVQTLIANGGGPAGRDARFGALTVAGSLSQIIGPAVAGFLYDTAGMPSTQVMLVSAIPAAVATVLAVSLWVRPPERSLRRRREQATQPRDSFLRTVGSVLRQPSVPHAMLASLTVLTSIDLTIAYLPAYGEANGIAASTVGLMLSVRAMAGMGSRVFMLPMLRRSTRRRLLSQSMLLPAVALASLPLTTNVPTLLTLFAVAGFGLGLGQPLSMAWISDAVPRTVRGTALGVRITGNRLAQLLVPVGAGAVAGATGVGAIFALSGATLGLGSLVTARAPTSGERSATQPDGRTRPAT